MVSFTISGPAAAALASLDNAQVKFIEGLPKAELHAHLNGSIPIGVLQELAQEYQKSNTNSTSAVSNDKVQEGLQKLLDGPRLDEISDFFTLFPVIYALTSDIISLKRVTRAVLDLFLSGDTPQCTYIELRSTPRETEKMSREQYVRAVAEEVAAYGPGKAGSIVSLDRRMTEDVLAECISVAKNVKSEGLPIVGVDLCGDPTAGDMKLFRKYFEEAKASGLGITLHIAETIHNTPEETLELLSFHPDRLGHATFLDDEAQKVVTERNTPIEICLTSNLLCKTVTNLDVHHIRHYLKEKHPIAICTDDTLPFQTSMLGEYALLMAKAPLGLGLSEVEVAEIAEMSLQSKFATTYS